MEITTEQKKRLASWSAEDIIDYLQHELRQEAAKLNGLAKLFIDLEYDYSRELDLKLDQELLNRCIDIIFWISAELSYWFSLSQNPETDSFHFFTFEWSDEEFRTWIYQNTPDRLAEVDDMLKRLKDLSAYQLIKLLEAQVLNRFTDFLPANEEERSVFVSNFLEDREVGQVPHTWQELLIYLTMGVESLTFWKDCNL